MYSFIHQLNTLKRILKETIHQSTQTLSQRILEWPLTKKIQAFGQKLSPHLSPHIVTIQKIINQILEKIKEKYIQWIPEKHRLVLGTWAKKSKKPFKKTLKIITYAYISFFVALLIVTLVVDPNQYKSNIEKFVYEQSGQALVLHGRVQWRCLPTLSIKAEEVMLKNTPTSHKEFFKAQVVRIKPSLFALMFGKCDLKATLQGVRFKTYHFPQVYSRLTYRSGVLKLSGLEVDLAKGKELGKLVIDHIKVDTRGELPLYSLRHEGHDFQLPLLMSVLNMKARITGKTSVKMDLRAKGKGINAIKRSLHGICELEIAHGKVHGLDLLGTLKEAKSLLATVASKITHSLVDLAETLTNRHHDPSGITPFHHLQIHCNIDNGILSMHHLHVNHSHFQVRGKGGINLANETMDYLLEAHYKEHGSIRSSEIHKGKLAPLVVRVTGPMADPKIKPDYESYFKYLKQGNPMDLKKVDHSSNHTHHHSSKKSEKKQSKKNITHTFKKWWNSF